MFGLPYHWAVGAGVTTILVYTFLGGFLAVSWTDLVQGLLMAAALVVVPLMAISAGGGWEESYNAISDRQSALLSPLTGRDGRSIGVFAAMSLLGWGLGYFGQPHILARFKAIRSATDVGPARRIAVGWTLLALIGGTLVGLAGIGYLDPALEGPDTEKVFMLLVDALFHPVIAGLLLAAILAAIMSTADSQLLVSAAVLSEDFYKAILRPAAGPRELVAVGRAAVIGIAVAAAVMALDPESKVLDLVAYAWAGFGAAFGPALILALYWRRMNRAGALAGILTGGVCVVIWKPLAGGPAGLFDLYELVPAFGLALGAIVIFSLLGPPPTAAVTNRHDAFLNRLRQGPAPGKEPGSEA